MAPSKRSRSNLAAQLAELDDPTPKGVYSRFYFLLYDIL